MKVCYVLAFCLLSFLSFQATAQMPTVSYDYELNRLRGNEPLPSETEFMVMGATPPNVNFVEISLFSGSGREDREPITVGDWKMPFDSSSEEFQVPITHPLPPGKKYDLQVDYYAPVDSADLQAIYQTLVTYIRSYLFQSFEINKNKIKLRNSSKQTYRELNTLVTDGLRRYRSTTEPLFEGFSEIVKLKLEDADGAETTYRYAQVVADSVEANVAIRRELPDALNDLSLFILSELQFALSKDLSERIDHRYVDNVGTDKSSGYFGIDVGYGGAFFGNEISNYDSDFYLGLDYPLATSATAPRFFRNASLGFGVFLNNFEDKDERTITGPVIKRPFYVALQYKLIYFIRLNLGASVLEREAVESDRDNAVLVRPFVGLSARVNVSLSLDK